MPLTNLKVTRDEQKPDETAHGENVEATAITSAAIDPRRLRRMRARHLDVNAILERSLPRVAENI